MADGIKSVTETIKLVREDGDFECVICFIQKNFTEQEAAYFLHDVELQQFKERQTEKRKQAIRLGKYVAKHAVQKALNEKPSFQDFYIKKGVFFHPVIYAPFAHNINVSVTHSKNIGTAISFPEAHPMGIDVECIQNIKPEVVATKSTRSERALMETALGSKQLAAAYLWTAKEALSKSIKTGLFIDFKFMEVVELKFENGILHAHFKSFGQYRLLTFHTNELVCSIVLPKKTTMDLSSFKNALANYKLGELI